MVERQINILTKEIFEKDSQISQLQEENETNETKIKSLEIKIEEQAKELYEAYEEIGDRDRTIYVKEVIIDDLKDQLKEKVTAVVDNETEQNEDTHEKVMNQSRKTTNMWNVISLQSRTVD